nr:hypothetical protein GCM10020093_076470 [Planobispora longispora]
MVLSPGFSLNRATLTMLAEELASKGYVVALVDHAYESFGTTFPGGRTLTCVACDTIEKAPSDEAEKKLLGRAAAGRAADISFVVDELTRAAGHRPAWKRWKMIDPKRIGAAATLWAGTPPPPSCPPTAASAPARTWTAPSSRRCRGPASAGGPSSWSAPRRSTRPIPPTRAGR